MILVRHPPVAASGVCYGRTDVTLADGPSATALAARLAHFGGTVWSSPAQRCRAVALALGPHRVDGRLQELDFGAWENTRWADVPRDLLDAWAADPWEFHPPGGETGAALVARVRAFAAGLLPGTHVIISHGGPLKVLAAVLCGRPIDLLAAPPALGSVTVVSALRSAA